MILFFLANYFDSWDHVNNEMLDLLEKLLLNNLERFSPGNFILGLKLFPFDEPIAKVVKYFKVYKPIVAQNNNLFGLNFISKPKNKELLIESQSLSGQLFLSNLTFLNDLLSIPKIVAHEKPKPEKLAEIKALLEKINEGLPSLIYIPSEGILQSPRSSDKKNDHCKN